MSTSAHFVYRVSDNRLVSDAYFADYHDAKVYCLETGCPPGAISTIVIHQPQPKWLYQKDNDQ